MSCKNIYLLSYDVMSPVNPSECSFADILFSPEKYREDKQQFDMLTLIRPYVRELRRMNRTSSIAYISASNAIKRSKLTEKGYDCFRFGTICSTTNASYENVLRILNPLYSKGTTEVSPIDFTYSVGNSLLSGITKKYQLKGTSGVFPSSEPLFISKMIFNDEDADYLLLGSYNICLDENIKYYSQVDFMRGSSDTSKGEDDSGMTIRESAVSMVLGNEKLDVQEKAAQLCSVVQITKTNCSKESYEKSQLNTCSAYDVDFRVEFSEYEQKDFRKAMELALKEADVTEDEIDAVFSCSCGNLSMSKAEGKAIEELFSGRPVVKCLETFGGNFGGNFMLNSIAASECLKHNQLPGVEKTQNPLKCVIVTGFNDLGNIISGVWKWN